MSKFYVGQKVRDHIVKPGKIGAVENIDIHSLFPLNVRWDDGNDECYTLDGRWDPDFIITLVDADDEWYVVHNPATRFEKWERVLVPDGIEWRYRHKLDENLVGKVTEE